MLWTETENIYAESLNSKPKFFSAETIKKL
jgi:hypothetical protein